jgi:phosphoadenosine phosphosulfate reductase
MDEQLYLMAVGLSLEEKIEKAIETFRVFEHEALKRDPVNGYYLCDSYGKDSCVILELAKRSGVKFQAHHNLTTLDPPELVLFGRKNHPDTVVHKPAVPMLRMLSDTAKGAPTRWNRWCCEKYKEGAGKGLVRVTGVRAAESARRKATWRLWQPRREADSWMLNVILYWTDEDVWRYLRSLSVPYCGLYDNGKARLGCIGCPMSPEQRKMDFERWPKYAKAWRAAISRHWDKYHGIKRLDGGDRACSRFRSADEMWDWWMEENQPEAEDDCQMGLF